MPFQEQKRPASSLPNADKGSVITFIDENGVPSTKDENGVVRPLVRPGPRIVWKGDIPGNPFIVGDSVNAELDTVIMVNVADPDVVTINLPPITPESAGRSIGTRNLVNKKSLTVGLVVLVPDPADIIELFVAGQAAFPGNPIVHLTMEADGVGRWNLPGGGGLFFTPYP
jgi:hypothetical protein